MEDFGAFPDLQKEKHWHVELFHFFRFSDELGFRINGKKGRNHDRLICVANSVTGERLACERLIGYAVSTLMQEISLNPYSSISSMADVRLKVILNKGREGIPAHKLAEFAKEIDKFLRMFSSDLQIEKPEWVAERFKNGSLMYENRLVTSLPNERRVIARKALEQITSPKTKADMLSYGIRHQTYGQFAKIVAPADNDEAVVFGIYTDKGTFSKRILNKKRAEIIEKQVKQRINRYCGYRGTISAFYPGSNKVHITEKTTGQVINCVFTSALYPHIIKALNKQNTVVNVEGWLRQEISEDSAYLYIEHLSEMPIYQQGDLEKFFGCDPDFTGEFSTEEYLNEIRDSEFDSMLIS